MGISVETLAVAKKYTNRSIEGITGTLAGKNATIDSITDITGGHRVTFKWTADNGDVRTQSMDVMDGAKGDKGETGATGATGAQGIQGIAGTQGIQGPKGDKGDTGATGAQGLQGIQGPQGTKGDKGDDGYPFLIYKQYDNISEFNAADFPEIGLMFMVMVEDYDPTDPSQSIGYPIYRYTGSGTPPYSLIVHLATQGIKGEKGDKGDKGDTGAQGIQGEKGDTGAKGDQGEAGPQGIQGVQGEQGPTGATGPKGEQGDPGEGVPEGGTTGQVLKKKSNTDYDTEWGEAASPLTFASDDFDVSEENEVSLDISQRVFTGTQAEWDALSTAVKKTYGQANITDDESGVSSSGQKYVSASVTVSETSWTSKIFTFNTNIPKGKYLIGAKFAPSAGDKSVHCVISNLTSAFFVPGYGLPISVATSEIYTKDTDGAVSMNYSCAINAANNPVAISLILIKIG